VAILYPRGKVLLVRDVADQNGRNHKTRSVVAYADFDPKIDEYLFCVAVTGTFDRPLPETSTALAQQPPALVEMFPQHFSAAGKSRLKFSVPPAGTTAADFAIE